MISVNQNRKFVIIGIVSVAVALPLIYLSFLNQENLSSEEQMILEVPSAESIDAKVRSIKTDNPEANKILSGCGTDKHCTVELLWNLVDVEQEKSVLQTLNDITSAYAEVGFYCHGPAHHLGMFVYDMTQNLTKTLEFGAKRDCGGAMYHGGIENYFLSEMILNKGDADEIEFTHICVTLADDAKKMKRVECAHGIGHGLAKVYDHDVFSSVKRCDEFSDPTERRLCYEGVFMENVVAYTKVGAGTFDKDDLFYPCNKLDAKYAGACFYYHASYILDKRTTKAAFEECDKVKPEISLIFCYMGLGRQTSASFFDNIQGIIQMCEEGIPEYQKYCYQGALIVIADHRGFEDSFEACKVFPQLFKMDCYTLLGDWIRIETPSKEDREKGCSNAENSKYFEVCVNARI